MADQSDTTFAATAASSHAEAVAGVSRDLKRLLDNDESARLKSDVREHIEALSEWTGTYLDGLEAARKISESAGPTLAEAQKELELALEQYLRLEDEGGNPATPKQQRQTDDLSRALRRLHGLIPAVDQTFASAAPEQPEPEMEPPEQEPGVAPEITPPLDNPPSPPDVQPDIPPVTNPDMSDPAL